MKLPEMRQKREGLVKGKCSCWGNLEMIQWQILFWLSAFIKVCLG